MCNSKLVDYIKLSPFCTKPRKAKKDEEVKALFDRYGVNYE